ncbi:MAG: hypothetical protein OSJ72_07215 [Lachnospiraceae bacterium]|nr:hypothetical protein [Lachnospiraceae bacterium]
MKHPGEPSAEEPDGAETKALVVGWPKAWAAFKMAKEVWTEETACYE